MAWGDDPWGMGPWGGGIADYAANGLQIYSVQFITPNLILLGLNSEVVVNTTYLNPLNYSISLASDTPLYGVPVAPVAVLAPANNVVKANYVFLTTTGHTDGSYYTVGFNQLTVLSGAVSLASALTPYASRVTKTMNVNRIPSHFDTRPTSLLGSTLEALSVQDDKIGGSRSDDF